MNNVVDILNSTVSTSYESAGNATRADLSLINAEEIDIEVITENVDANNVAVSPGTGKVLTVYYAFSSVLIAQSSDYRKSLIASSNQIKLTLPALAGAKKTVLESFKKTARYLYIWTEHDPIENNIKLLVRTINGVSLNYPAYVVSFSPPADDTYTETDNLDFVVTFDRAITVVGSPVIRLTLSTGDVDAVYTSGTGTTALTFRYTVQAEDEATDGISVSDYIFQMSGTLKDTNKIDANLALPAVDTSNILIELAT